MTEPDVALTDYLLAVECTAFVWLLARRGLVAHRRWWMVFFVSIGAAAAVGGTVHGFFLDPASAGNAVLWRLTLVLIGLTAFSIWALGAEMLLSTGPRNALIAVAAAEFAAYSAYVLFFNQEFLTAALNYLPAAVFLLVVFAARLGRGTAGARDGVVGLLLSFAAAGVQIGGVGLHPKYFNHNALYHLIEAVALYFLYRSATSSSMRR